jgi:hypothetical protein
MADKEDYRLWGRVWWFFFLLAVLFLLMKMFSC